MARRPRRALEVKSILEENGLTGWPKTSGSRGMHINVRIHPRWTFTEVRRAALALARAVERRVPTLASSKWWKEERHGVFLDYNQNAKDRTTASAYSVRPLPDARVSAPLHWHEVPDANPADFTVLTMPQLFAERGNPHEAMDAAPGSLDQLLALAARDEAEGLGDAPWPPHFAKAEGEPKRVQPSKAKSFDPQMQPKASEPTASRNAPKPQPNPPPPKPNHPHRNPPHAKPQPAARPNTLSSSSRSHPTKPPPKPASLAGKKNTPKPQPTSPKTTSSSTACAALHASGIASASTYATSPKTQRPAQSTPDPDDDPTRAWREASRLG